MEATRKALRGYDAKCHARDAALAPGLPLSLRCMHVDAFEKLGLSNIPVEAESSTNARILRNSAAGLIVSFEPEKAAVPFPRVVIGTDRHDHYECANSSCKRHNKFCCHVDEFSKFLDDKDLYDTVPFSNFRFASKTFQKPGVEARQRKPAKSTTPIPLNTVAPRVKRRVSGECIPWIEGVDVCVPDSTGTCPACGSAWKEGDPVTEGWKCDKKGTLYGPSSSIPVTVYYRPCSMCDAKKDYDGFRDGVFNYSNETLFLHEVMLMYVDAIRGCRMPFNAYFLIMERQYARFGEEFLGKSTLIGVIQAFCDLLDIDYDGCFDCPICSTLPWKHRIAVMDGKCMGFRRDMMRAEPQDDVTRAGPNINTANFTYLKRSKHGFGAFVRMYAAGTMSDERIWVRMKNIAKTVAPELLPLLQVFPCPKEHARFLKSISTEYPINNLIDLDLAHRLPGIIDAEVLSPEDRALIQYRWPALYDLISQAQWDRIPLKMKPLFVRLMELALLPSAHGSYPEPEFPSSSNLGGWGDRSTFLPGLDVVRPRILRPGTPEKMACTKHIKRSPVHTPGLFGLFCPHGVCLGFQAMKDFEGPMTAFDILYRRFPEPPGIVIYDNACALHRCCMKHAPAHFSRTKFYVDRVHWCGHKGCHEGYCMNSYDNNTPVLDGKLTLGQINSQVCEQTNSKLELIVTQTKYMSEDNYMAYIKLFLYMSNEDAIKKIKETLVT